MDLRRSYPGGRSLLATLSFRASSRSAPACRSAPCLNWSSTLGVVLRAMMCTAFSGGFRKAELALPAGAKFDNMRIARSSLKWRIKGRIVSEPTLDQLHALQRGAFAMVIPPLCSEQGRPVRCLPRREDTLLPLRPELYHPHTPWHSWRSNSRSRPGKDAPLPCSSPMMPSQDSYLLLATK